jgi:hypothetical protein
VSTSGSGAALSTDELRAAVRAVLRDVFPLANATATTPDGELSLRTDADLTAFVRRVALLCEDATQRAELQAGRHRFRLAAGASGLDGLDRRTSSGRDHPASSGRDRPASGGLDHRASGAAGSDAVERVDRGAVTERAVKKAAANGKRLVLGRRAVLTPLARDKARSLGVVIEKES